MNCVISMWPAARILLLALAPALAVADQAGAETTKKPVSAVVVPVRPGGEGLADKDAGDHPEPVGNVEVTYADGTKDRWTVKGNAGMPRVAPDGTVGWVVFEPERKASTASDLIRPNHQLVLCRAGKVLARVESALGFIEEWEFVDGGSGMAGNDGRADPPPGLRVVVKSRALHGPAVIQLFEAASGKEAGNVKAFERPLPGWAEKLGE